MEYLLPKNFYETCNDCNEWQGKYKLPKKIVTIHTDKILSELELFSYLCKLHGSNDVDTVIKEYKNIYDDQQMNIKEISNAFNAYRKNAVKLHKDDTTSKIMALGKMITAVAKDFNDYKLNQFEESEGHF